MLNDDAISGADDLCLLDYLEELEHATITSTTVLLHRSLSPMIDNINSPNYR